MRPRIILSLATVEDIDFLVGVKTDADLWRFEDDLQTDTAIVRKTVAERINSDWYRQYIIRLDDGESTPIGEIHIHWYVRERRSWEIGYCVFPEHRGRGYCTQAVELVLGYAFGDWGAHKVVAMCNAHNEASYRVMERVGMTREAVFREELPWRGQWADQYFYCILDHEYFEWKSRRTGAT